jgi:hypothetical protein
MTVHNVHDRPRPSTVPEGNPGSDRPRVHTPLRVWTCGHTDPTEARPILSGAWLGAVREHDARDAGAVVTAAVTASAHRSLDPHRCRRSARFVVRCRVTPLPAGHAREDHR